MCLETLRDLVGTGADGHRWNVPVAKRQTVARSRPTARSVPSMNGENIHMLSTMGDVDITIPLLFHFGRTVFPSSVVRPVVPKLSQDAR